MHHSFPFDPSYGYDLSTLKAVEPPVGPPDFADFWRARYADALAIDATSELQPSSYQKPGFTVSDLTYRSTEGFLIHGWLLVPKKGEPKKGFIVGHGYGGVEQPEFDPPCADAAYLLPCFRGLGCSRQAPISEDPAWHVLHDINDRNRYIIGGCVADVWVGVSALLQRFPRLSGNVSYTGISFGGGVGALALAWDERIARGYLNVPTFGNQPLRLKLATIGSGAAVQHYADSHPAVVDTLAYFDSAVAARHIRQPMLIAAALFDPAVAPPGQFSIYNALPGPKQLFVLQAGHFDYPEQSEENRRLLEESKRFFSCDESRIP